jgi:hypothetical protein
MAVTEEKDGALATAAAAAAAGAAVYGLKKALKSGDNGKSSRSEHDDDYDDDGEESTSGGAVSGAGGFLSSVWESASDSLVPLAEEAADAAGKWVAENAPDLVRDRIVPRFIESFQDAA